MFILGLMTPLLLSLAQLAQGQDERVTLYSWLGQEAAGELVNTAYVRAVEDTFAGQNVIVEKHPNKKRILEMAVKADILYAAVHSGYSELEEGGVKNMTACIRTEKGDPEGSPITAWDLFQLRKSHGDEVLPRLVAIIGCNILAYPEKGPKVLRIPEAFGIGESTMGRAALGFETSTLSILADEIYLEIFAQWTRKKSEAEYPTLREACDWAVDALTKSGAKAGVIGMAKIVKIHGDPNLRYSDILAYAPLKRHLRALRTLGLKGRMEVGPLTRGKSRVTQLNIKEQLGESDEPGVAAIGVAVMLFSGEDAAKSDFEVEYAEVVSDASREWAKGTLFDIGSCKGFVTHRYPFQHYTYVSRKGTRYARYAASARIRRGKAVIFTSSEGISRAGNDGRTGEGRQATDQQTLDLGKGQRDRVRALLEKYIQALEADK